jgi:hypothetical protein
MVINV